MDPVEDILRFHRPLDDESFKREVKRLRDRAGDPKWLYMPVKRDQRELWQGDILPHAELPFVAHDGEIEVVEQRAMLLSTTCDAVPNQDPTAVLAPVYPVLDFAQELSAERRRNLLSTLKANTFARYFYLPAAESMPESYVDFSGSASVSNVYLHQLCEHANVADRVRLSRLGWYFFNYKLGYYYSRAEDEREVPRSGASRGR